MPHAAPRWNQSSPPGHVSTIKPNPGGQPGRTLPVKPAMSIRTSVCFILLACCALLCPSRPAAADDGGYWPQFRGPNRDGVSPETGLLRSWPEGGPPLRWTAEGLGHGFAAVSIAAGMIYTAGDQEGTTLVTALDLAGHTRWQVPNGQGWIGTQPGHPGARGVPTVDRDQVLHLNPFGQLVALEAKTGQPRWGLNILDTFESTNLHWALSASVLIDGEQVIVVPGGPRTAVVALDRRDGRILWESPSVNELAGYGSPIAIEHDGLRMIITLTEQSIIGVRATDGALLWQHPHQTRWDENIFTPIHHRGRVFVSTQFTGSVLLQLHVHGTTASVAELWRSTNLDNHHGGAVLWDGYVYGSGRGNGERWACLDWETGALQHLERGVGKGSVVAADGMLYTLSERGVVGLVPVTRDRHEVVAQFRIPAGGQGPVFAHPVVSGGRLYLRHGQVLFCYDIKAAQP